MAEGEKFNIIKWFSGFVNPLTNAKNVQYTIWIVGILFALYTVWRAYFMPHQTQNQSQRALLVALPGSTVSYAPQQGQEQKTEAKKRPWWLPALFVEGYGFHEQWADGSRTGVGTRAGGRLEW